MITLDTNIFLYTMDDRVPLKQSVAAAVVRRAADLDCPIGLQVIGEAQNVAMRKFKMPGFVAAQFGRNLLGQFRTFGSTADDVEVALGQLAAARLSYWDALLISCARRAGCTTMISEDLQDGATVLGVEIVNPFGAAGLSARASEVLRL